MNASEYFVEMYHVLDEYIENGRLVVFGVFVTTLDEVFLMVARGESGHKKSITKLPNTTPIPQQSYRTEDQITEGGLFLMHTTSLFAK